MAQQAAPEVGAVMDGYRFKGGDPKQESSWEQVAPIPAPEYGQGAQRLPNGAVVRYGPRGGMDTIVSAAQAASASGGGDGGTAMVGADARARFMINLGPLQQAQANLERLDAEGYNPSGFQNTAAAALEAIPFDGGYAARIAGGPDYNAYTQAAKTFEAAILPIMSGAAVTPSEAQRLIRAALPQPGDTPEVLRQKAEQRRQMINAVAKGIGEAEPYAEGTATTATQPPQPASPATSGPTASAISVGTFNEPVADRTPEQLQAEGYARGEDGVWRKEWKPEELEALGYSYDPQNQQWIAPGGGNAGGAPPAPPPAGPQAPQDGGGQTEGYRTALEQERATLELLGQHGGKRYDQPGFLDQVTAPFNDELGFLAGYAPQALANLGRTVTGQEIEVGAMDRGRAVRDLTREGSDRFAREHPGQNAAAQVLGSAAFGPGGAARSMLGRAAQGAGMGATYGMAGAEGNVIERLPETAIGAGLGAVAVPVVERAVAPALNALARPVVQGVQSSGRFLGRQAGGVGNALGVPGSQRLVTANQPNPLASGMDRFARRSPQQPDVMGQNALAMRSQEIEPVFADVVNDGGRGTLRALATRQTPARQAAREFADGRAAGLQDRISTQARRTISDDPRSPLEIRTETAARRTSEADQAFGAVRGETIAPEREVIEALRAPALKPAIEEAATAALNRGDSETANMLRQLGEGALDNPNGVRITVGMADRLARSLNGKAETFQRGGNNDAAASYFALAERLRGSARQQVPGYDTALNAYAADSRLLSASELGEQFMSMEADQFAAAVAKLAPEERQVAQAAARRAVERQAGTQGGAPGVAQRLSNGREQGARTQALTGDAAPVQQAMGAELQALRNAQGISPAQGSPTSMNAQDAMNAAGAVRDVATLNAPGLAGRAMTAIRSRGFSDTEAEALVQAAIDPAQTNQLIDMLAERMTRREARNLARAIRYQLTTSLPTNQ